MQMTDKVYDVLKNLALIILPAFSAAYFSLAGIWGLPAAEQIVGTCAVISTFLGAILKVSQVKYDKVNGGTDGDLIVTEDEDGKNLRFVMDRELNDLDNRKRVSFKVKRRPIKVEHD